MLTHPTPGAGGCARTAASCTGQRAPKSHGGHDMAQGKGQWRIRGREYRLRYDVIGRDVTATEHRPAPAPPPPAPWQWG